MPEKPPVVLIAGFVCKSNSCMNSGRFDGDPCGADRSSQKTSSALALLEKLRPKYFILENVVGAAKPLGSTGTAGFNSKSQFGKTTVYQGPLLLALPVLATAASTSRRRLRRTSVIVLPSIHSCQSH